MEELFTLLLNLPALEVTLCEVDERHITLHCRSVLGESHCPLCLEKCNFVKDTRVRRLRDLSISGKEVALLLTSRQFVCRKCNRHFHERFGFVRTNATMTTRYEDFIYFRCQGTDLRTVSLQEDLCWSSVRDIFERHARREVDSRDALGGATRIGIDEIALRKGHRDFVPVLVDLATGQVLDILPERGKESLKSYFLSKGEAFCQQVTCFCSDMWEGYLACAREVFPNARIVADRFHFFAHMNKELDRCRRAMRKQYPKEEALKHLRWALLMPPEKLGADGAADLAKVLEDPRFGLLARTWRARNQFRDILETDLTPQQAAQQVDEWEKQHTRQPNRFVQRFVGFYRKWKSYILNYFEHRHTTSIIEGINNKLKLIKRRAYGFLTFEAFRLRALVEFH